MATVPNWIAKAVIVHPGRYGEASLTGTRDWRATKTQAVVTDEYGRERRFYLDTLTEVGGTRSVPELCVHLAPPDDPVVITSKRASAVSKAGAMVLDEVERQRLQDHADDAGVMVQKLTAVRDAANAALAGLVDYL